MSSQRLNHSGSGRNWAYSKLSEILATNHTSVAQLSNRLRAKGISFDRKTLYRLASAAPLLSISTPVLKAVCEELQIGIGDVLGWEPPQPRLHRIDDATQERLSTLMAKSNENELSDSERAELERLGSEAERLSLENARILAAATKPKRGVTHCSTPPKLKVTPRRKVVP